MTRYIIRRLLQAVPTLFFISVIVYGLIMISPVDPMAIYEDNPNLTPEDMAMLEYRLGLRQPAFLNFRGSSGVVNEYTVLYNKPPGSEAGGTEPKETGQIGAGTRVAVVDEEKNDTGVYVKVLDVPSRVTGWTSRSNLSIKVNPLDSRYFKWLFALLQGDFGRSNVERRPALEMMLERIPATLQLMTFAFLGSLAGRHTAGHHHRPEAILGHGSFLHHPGLRGPVDPHLLVRPHPDHCLSLDAHLAGLCPGGPGRQAPLPGWRHVRRAPQAGTGLRPLVGPHLAPDTAGNDAGRLWGGPVHALHALQHAGGDPPGLYPHRPRQGPLGTGGDLEPTPSRTRPSPS